MAAKVKLRRSTIAGHVPASLESGQIAINEADGKLFWRDQDGAVQAADLDATKEWTLGEIAAAITTAVDDLKGGVSSAYDTLVEIAAKLTSEDAAIAGLLSAVAGKLDKAQNLGDLQDPGTARTNLGLGTAATKDVGTGNGNIPQLDANGKVQTSIIPFASQLEAEAGAATDKPLNALRVKQAIEALAKAGWEQIGTTQTLASSAAFVEQSWTETYREVMCILFSRANGAQNIQANLRDASSSLGLANTSVVLSTSVDGMARIVLSLMPGKGMVMNAAGGSNLGGSAAGSSFGGAVPFTGTPDRLRVSLTGGATFSSGGTFAFFGMG